MLFMYSGKTFQKNFNMFLDSPHAFKKQQQLAAHAWSIKVVDFLNIMYNLQYIQHENTISGRAVVLKLFSPQWVEIFYQRSILIF